MMEEQRLRQELQSGAGRATQDVISGFGGTPPPGSELSAAGGVKVPLNRELSTEQLSAITAERVFNPAAREIKQSVKGGVYRPTFTKNAPKPFGFPLAQNLERTGRQAAAGQQNPIFTSLDPKLQATQSKISSLRRYVFGEGGKQLTPTELNIVNALITPYGKSDEQIELDLDEALKLINEKSNLARGGSLAEPLPSSSGFQGQQDDPKTRFLRRKGLI